MGFGDAKQAGALRIVRTYGVDHGANVRALEQFRLTASVFNLTNGATFPANWRRGGRRGQHRQRCEPSFYGHRWQRGDDLWRDGDRHRSAAGIGAGIWFDPPGPNEGVFQILGGNNPISAPNAERN